MFRSFVIALLFLSATTVHASQPLLGACDLDTIYSVLFGDIGQACWTETGIDTTKPWDPTPSDISSFCGNDQCKAVTQGLQDKYPSDCYIADLDTNLLHGLFGTCPSPSVSPGTGNTGNPRNPGNPGPSDPSACNMDTIYGILFGDVGQACWTLTKIDTTKPWEPSPDDITAFCSNDECKKVNQLLHEAYPSDCYAVEQGTNLLHGLFGTLPCMSSPSPSPSGPSSTPGTPATSNGCSDGEHPMSVEGVATIYCVSGKPCAGNVSDGVCPGPQQPDLPYGSVCGLVRTNVYGCKPYLDAAHTKVGEVSAADLPNCLGNPAGSMPVSVVGQGTFCAASPICVGNQRGNCPDKLSGLPLASKCDYVRPGVLGCVMP